MCGIFGYIGKENSSEIVFEGLKKLEYRGYDSWGIAVATDHQITLSKKTGSIGDIGFVDFPKSNIGIGHTRWATHGGVTDTNAHPHFSSDKTFVLAQNGIVENFQILKKTLIEKGYKFISETDTEVIVHLIEEKLKEKKDFESAIRSAFLELEGRNTIIILNNKKEVIAARNGSPLVIGINDEKNEVFFSSDTLSFASRVKKIIIVENGQMVIYKNNELNLFDIRSNKKLKYQPQKVDLKTSNIDKEGYSHFMIKEIHESPYVIKQLFNYDANEYTIFIEALKKAKNVYTMGSGTAGIAASQIAFYLRVNAKLRVVSLIGADAQEYHDLLTKEDLIIVPSQSGETADVLEVLEYAKQKGVKIASFVNMQGSTMSRISDYKFMANSGPEICVMSTKVFTSQIAWGYLISKIAAGKENEALKNLKILTEKIEQYLNTNNNHSCIKNIAKVLSGKKDIFLLGKYQNFNIVKEGMVKIIEGSYKHAHGMPAGDLKHYAITLIEKGVPVICVISNDPVRKDILNAVNEVKARGAEVIGISPLSHESFDYHIKVPDTGETSAIMNIIPLQLLAYYMAVELGHNVDKPRNIAKSVTVK